MDRGTCLTKRASVQQQRIHRVSRLSFSTSNCALLRCIACRNSAEYVETNVFSHELRWKLTPVNWRNDALLSPTSSDTWYSRRYLATYLAVNVVLWSHALSMILFHDTCVNYTMTYLQFDISSYCIAVSYSLNGRTNVSWLLQIEFRNWHDYMSCPSRTRRRLVFILIFNAIFVPSVFADFI